MERSGSSPEQQRNAAIYVAVMDGATFGQLAQKYAISKVRVQKAYARERENASEQPKGVAPLHGASSLKHHPFPHRQTGMPSFFALSARLS